MANRSLPARSSYIDRRAFLDDPGHNWEAHTGERLRWAHGEERARAIALGVDAATSADLKAWRGIGR